MARPVLSFRVIKDARPVLPPSCVIIQAGPLRAVDTDKSFALRVLVVQDFNGVAVEDGDYGAGEFSSRGIARNQ